MPGAAIGKRCRLGLADRCAKKFSLQPPTVEGGEAACSKSLSGQHGRERKARPLLRCPARPSADAAASALPTAAPKSFRCSRQRWRAPARPSADAAASALPTAAPKNPPCIRRRRRSDFLPAPPALGFKSRQTKRKAPHFRAGLFLAEKEGFEPSRRFPDLRP